MKVASLQEALVEVNVIEHVTLVTRRGLINRRSQFCELGVALSHFAYGTVYWFWVLLLVLAQCPPLVCCAYL